MIQQQKGFKILTEKFKGMNTAECLNCGEILLDDQFTDEYSCSCGNSEFN
jgi:hypothetical protein